MFDELKKYKQNNHFSFTPTQKLKEDFNAPVDENEITDKAECNAFHIRESLLY